MKPFQNLNIHVFFYTGKGQRVPYMAGVKTVKNKIIFYNVECVSGNLNSDVMMSPSLLSSSYIEARTYDCSV
jgi:hypothetical protein